MADGDSHDENNSQIIKLVRFFMGAKLLGQTKLVVGDTIVEHAESAGVNIPTNCTSGTCGTCMVTLLSGEGQIYALPPAIHVVVR